MLQNRKHLELPEPSNDLRSGSTPTQRSMWGPTLFKNLILQLHKKSPKGKTSFPPNLFPPLFRARRAFFTAQLGAATSKGGYFRTPNINLNRFYYVFFFLLLLRGLEVYATAAAAAAAAAAFLLCFTLRAIN